MNNVINLQSLTATDTQITLEDKSTLVLRTDAPTDLLTEEEGRDLVNKAIALHTTFKQNMTTLITLDSYIQIGSTDTLVIAKPDERFAIVYPNGKFNVHSPLFYLDWVEPGMLIEVTGADDKMAKFVFVK